MALAASNLTNSGSGTPATSFTTASISPSVGNLLLVGVHSGQLGGTAQKIDVPQLAGDGITFKLLFTKATSASPTHRLTLFYAIVPAGVTTGALTISFTNSQALCAWTIESISGEDASSAIAWCVQSVQNDTAGTSANAALGVLQDTSSLVYGVLTTSGTVAQLTLGSGWTQLSKNSTGTVIASQYKVNDPNCGCTTSISETFIIIIAVEITASNSGLVNNPLASHLLGCSGAGS